MLADIFIEFFVGLQTVETVNLSLPASSLSNITSS